MLVSRNLLAIFILLAIFLSVLSGFFYYQKTGFNLLQKKLFLYYKAGASNSQVWGKLPRESNDQLKTGYVVQLDEYEGIKQGILSAITEGSPYEESNEWYLPLYATKEGERISFRLKLKGRVGVFLVKQGVWGRDMGFKPQYLEDLKVQFQKDQQVVLTLLGSGGDFEKICKYSKNDCDVLKELQKQYQFSNDKILSNGIQNDDEVGYIANIVVAVP